MVGTRQSETEGICHPQCICVQDGKIGLMFICIMPASSVCRGRLGEHFFHLIHHRVRFACVDHLDNIITRTKSIIKAYKFKI